METYLPPNKVLALRTIAMPSDTNAAGDMFGGWMVAQMDLASASFARFCTQLRVVTVSIDGFTFHKPVYVGDEVTCYTEVVRIGKTSITVKVESWVRRALKQETMKVTEGTFTFVALDENAKATEISKELALEKMRGELEHAS